MHTIPVDVRRSRLLDCLGPSDDPDVLANDPNDMQRTVNELESTVFVWLVDSVSQETLIQYYLLESPFRTLSATSFCNYIFHPCFCEAAFRRPCCGFHPIAAVKYELTNQRSQVLHNSALYIAQR